MSFRTFRPASMIACTRFTDSSRDIAAALTPIEPPMVVPTCAMIASAPASAMALASVGVAAANHRRFFDDRQPLVLANLHGDGVGITVGHEPGRRTVPGHPKAARVVDNDDVPAAALDELRADPRPRARGDNRFAFLQCL